jgi:hypothetical protein
MSILSSTNSGKKLAPITAGILEELGWVFHENQKCWDHWEYTNVEIYQETSFRKEAKEKRGRTPGNWYAMEYIPSITVGIFGSSSETKTRIIPLNSIGDLDLLENHKVVKTYSI